MFWGETAVSRVTRTVQINSSAPLCCTLHELQVLNSVSLDAYSNRINESAHSMFHFDFYISEHSSLCTKYMSWALTPWLHAWMEQVAYCSWTTPQTRSMWQPPPSSSPRMPSISQAPGGLSTAEEGNSVQDRCTVLLDSRYTKTSLQSSLCIYNFLNPKPYLSSLFTQEAIFILFTDLVILQSLGNLRVVLESPNEIAVEVLHIKLTFFQTKSFEKSHGVFSPVSKSPLIIGTPSFSNFT